MPTFVRVDSLQVHGMSNYVIFIWDAVSSQHVSSLPGNIQSFSTAVPLEHWDHFWCRSVMEQNLYIRKERRWVGEIAPRAEAKTKERRLTSFDQLVFPETDKTAGQWWSRSTCQPFSSAWADFWPVAHQTGFWMYGRVTWKISPFSKNKSRENQHSQRC